MARRKPQRIDSERFYEFVNSPDPLTLVVRGHICLEAVVNHILGNAVPKALPALRDADLDFEERVDLAIALGKIDPRFRSAWVHINHIRNRFAHQLDATITEEDGALSLSLLPTDIPWIAPPPSTLRHPGGSQAALGWCMAVLYSSAINTGLFGHPLDLPAVSTTIVPVM